MAGWRRGDYDNWVDLEYDDEEMAGAAMPSMPAPPQYPYGCRNCLTGRELEMLRLPLPKVGDQIELHILAEVTGVSDDRGEQRVELQWLKVENEDEEEEAEAEDEGEGDEAFPSRRRRYVGG